VTRLARTLMAAAAAAGGAAPQARMDAQSQWSVRAEAGTSALHDDSNTGGALALRLARDIRSGFVRAALGFASGAADGGFRTVDAALEFVLLPRSILTPVGALGIGGMVENDWNGAFVQVTGGLELRIHRRARLRGTLQGASHGENQLGPNLKMLGIALRLGRG
jgi:hypothetical protein